MGIIGNYTASTGGSFKPASRTSSVTPTTREKGRAQLSATFAID
jgi:hypothetical protein